jgi:quercetin dioxygenase-like cupin family protein
MKVNVIKDENGKVVATFENATAEGAAGKPVLKPGHTVHEVEAEEDYEADIRAFYQRHSR